VRPVGLLRRRDDAAFWSWFASACADVTSPADVDRDFLTGVTAALRRVDRRLDYEIGLRPLTDEMELVISAGGLDKVAPIAVALVAAAPDLPGWRATAFRPARPVAGTAIRVRDEVVAADEVWTSVAGSGDALVLTAHVAELDRCVADRMRAAHLLLEQAIGEETFVTRIVAVDWRSYAGAPPGGTLPLPDLAATLPG
jgi:hypothetical protein